MPRKKKHITRNSIGIFNSNPVPYSIVISNPNSEPVFTISESEIFYKHNNEMVKVNCPDDIIQAFEECVLHMTGYNSEDVMIEKYIQKILNHERSNDYMIKLESTFRKLKLQKLKNI